MLRRIKETFIFKDLDVLQNKKSNLQSLNLRNISKYLAFTLAEVLVVIGIIGVVSALTIPNLQEGTNSKEVVTKVTKARATFDEAYGRAIATYGDPCTWALDQTTAAAQEAIWHERILENLKIDKDCGLVDNTNTVCWDFNNIGKTHHKAKLADGISVAMKVNTSEVTQGYGCRTAEVFAMLFDIDGSQKGRNSVCDDVYAFVYYGNGSYVPASSSTGNLSNRDAGGCAAWILDKGNADFLKASTYSTYWKCPNGKVLDWANNTTCN